jgi:predicted outer membrane repeat protein
MHLKPVRTATGAFAVGGALVLGLGSTPAAMAQPTADFVRCSGSALATAISDADPGDALNLTPGCTYEISAALPEITKPISIVGTDGSTLRATASGFSLLEVGVTAALNLDGVNFSNADTTGFGGAIFNNGGIVTINGGTFTGNRAADDGGAIDSHNGILSVDHASFIGNSSTGEAGGAISTEGTKGGAIVTDSYFSWNTAPSEYGGAIYVDSGTGAQVTNSNFLANSAKYGGAVYNVTALDLIDDNITESHAASEGGGVYVDGLVTIIIGSQISLNSAVGADGGGGIYAATEVLMTTTSVRGNSPDNCSPDAHVSGCVG